MNSGFLERRIHKITDLSVTVACNKHLNFLFFFLHVALSTALSRFAVSDIALSFAGFQKEGFVYLNDAG